MPGRMGNAQVTLQNMEVVDVLKEKNLLLVKGAVPGPRHSYCLVRLATKKPPADWEERQFC